MKGIQNCILFWGANVQAWNDEKCNLTLEFICEIPYEVRTDLIYITKRGKILEWVKATLIERTYTIKKTYY